MDPNFSWDDFNGERQISTRLIESGDENPDILRVVVYESGRHLVFGIEGDGETPYYHAYLIEPNGKIKYSDQIFHHGLQWRGGS